MDASPVRVGLIGCGGIAEWHVKGYLRRPQDVRVTAVSDVVEENVRRISRDVGGASIFHDFYDLLLQSDVFLEEIWKFHVIGGNMVNCLVVRTCSFVTWMGNQLKPSPTQRHLLLSHTH